MKYESIWLEDITCDKDIKVLNGNTECDVLIIGGGMTGLSCAFHLINSNKKIIVAEANQVGMGISLRTTGKLTYLQEDIYSKLSDNYGFDIAKLYYESQKEAINIVDKIVSEYKIDCNFENVFSYVFTDKSSEVNKLIKEKNILNKFGVNVNNKRIPLDVESKYSICVDDTYVFHPLKYIRSLKKILKINNIDIYEKTKITNIYKKDCFYCESNGFVIKAKKIVLACHYPFFFASCLLPFKSHIEKSFLIALKNQKNLKLSLINLSDPIKSVRFYKNNMVFLSSSSFLCDKLDYVKRKNELVTYLKNNKDITHCWSNHDIITNDYLPLIGMIYDDVYIGTGYNTWGMTNSSIAGKIISDLIMGYSNKYVNLFNPNRKFNKLKLYNLPICIYANAKGFIMPYIKTNDFVKYKKINGEKVACYKGHIVKCKCPHMKCNLIFNSLEKTWDCLCHGSRFTYDGLYIIGPSKKDIVFKDK